MAWTTEPTAEFDAWFDGLSLEDKVPAADVLFAAQVGEARRAEAAKPGGASEIPPTKKKQRGRRGR